MSCTPNKRVNLTRSTVPVVTWDRSPRRLRAGRWTDDVQGGAVHKEGHVSYKSVCLFVKDISSAVAFYTTVLGLNVRADFGKNVILDGGITLWEIAPDHILVDGLSVERLTDRRASRFELYFETKDLDAALVDLESNGVELVHPAHEEPWGQRNLRFRDCDGHLIEIGESMATFVGRLAEQMDFEQVSDKTGIPVEMVERLLG